MDSNLVMWGLIVGFFMPVLLAIVQQPGWTSPVRSIVMFVASLAAGAGTVYFAGNWDTTNLVTTILLVMVTAIATYKGLWQPTTVAPKVEAATSPKSE
jgi:peptidoglycan/LPS O-acetylase OafA/YrhL